MRLGGATTVTRRPFRASAADPVAQRHDDELANRRDQLTLEIAILSERKTAKIIALLEEFASPRPASSDEPDGAAEALAEPSDPQAVLGAIDAAHGEAREKGKGG